MSKPTIQELIDAFEDYLDAVEQYLDGQISESRFNKLAAEAEAKFEKADTAVA